MSIKLQFYTIAIYLNSKLSILLTRKLRYQIRMQNNNNNNILIAN